MQVEQFIREQIIKALLAEGFPRHVIDKAAGYGIDHYRRMSQASRKGRAFDDCLYFARQWANGQTTTAERKAGKKKPGRGDTQPGLF